LIWREKAPKELIMSPGKIKRDLGKSLRKNSLSKTAVHIPSNRIPPHIREANSLPTVEEKKLIQWRRPSRGDRKV